VGVWGGPSAVPWVNFRRSPGGATCSAVAGLLRQAASLDVYALVYALVVAMPVVMSFREFRAGLAGVLDRVRQSPADVVYVGSHRRAEAVLVSVERYEALLETSERQHAVAAALASVRAEGLEPGADDLALFVQVAAGDLTTDELRERVLSRYRARPQR
jgi:PHD/YefM family antitoxin component YafN of YafNO toxin-antitoxin module